MRPAVAPDRNRANGKLLHIDVRRQISHHHQTDFAKLLSPSDVVIANDAATLPASLSGIHVRTSEQIEVRLAAWASPTDQLNGGFIAVVFGAGDYRMRTEDRPAPPPLKPGDEVVIAGVTARIVKLLDHPRLVELQFANDPRAMWAAMAAHGVPIQYSYVRERLQLWDTWTCIAAVPLAFEAPSAGFALSWATVMDLRRRGIGFATVTHAAGISSTGDVALDQRLPFDEFYRIPQTTATLISAARRAGRRIVAIGTSVVRALEDVVQQHGRVVSGAGIARLRIEPATRLRVVDAVLSGAHQRGESHFELLRAFADDDVLERATQQLESHGYMNHEFGDSVLIEASKARNRGFELLDSNPADLTRHAG